MPDLRILAAIGAAVIVFGVVTLAVSLARRTRPAVLPTDIPSWAADLPPAAADLTALIPAVTDDGGGQAATEVLPAVPDQPGRHRWPGTAEDSGAIPRHGWRPDEQVVEP